VKIRFIAVAAAAAIIAGGTLTAVPASAASSNGTVVGHIRSVSGAAIAGAQVVVARVDGTVVPKKTTTTKSGRYEMALKPGAYTLSAVDPKDRYASSLTATSFTVEPGAADHVNKRLAAGASITGKVTTSSGKRLSGVSVRVFGVNERGAKLPVESGTTNSKGEFKIRGLTAGTYDVNYNRDGYVDTYYDGGKGIAGWYGTGEKVTVATGKKRTGTSASLQVGAKVTGRVLVNGVEASEAYGEVEASVIRKSDGFVLETQVIGDYYSNAFKFPGLPAGDYIIRFAGLNGAPIASDDLPVTLRAGESRTGLVEELKTTGPVRVSISAEITPVPVVPGTGPFTLAVMAHGYNSASGAAVTISYDGKVQQTGTLDGSSSATFSVPSDYWVGAPVVNTPPITIDVAATATTHAATTTIAPTLR
jgi:hypothetical protein